MKSNNQDFFVSRQPPVSAQIEPDETPEAALARRHAALVAAFGESRAAILEGRLPPEPLADLTSEPSNASDDHPHLDNAPPDDVPPPFIRQISKLKTHLRQKVIGQDGALDAICDALLKRISATVYSPVTALLFVGPDGVGKRLTCEGIAQAMGDDWSSYHLDMSSMLDFNNSDALDGNEPSYHNASPGKLTRFVLKNPKTVVVFDNIERAHPVVLNRLAGLAATGKLRDRFGMRPDGKPDPDGLHDIDFSQCILVFLTEAGETVYDDKGIAQLLQDRPELIEQMLLDTLSKTDAQVSQQPSKLFSPAFLNCFKGGRTILFERLKYPALVKIAGDILQAAMQATRSSLRCEMTGMEATEDLVKSYLLSLCPAADTATIHTRIPHLFIDRLMDRAMSLGKVPKTLNLHISPRARKQLDEVFARFGAADPVQECQRRGLKLHVTQSLDSETSDEHWRLSLDHVELRRITAAEDLQGPGAIRTEVPDIAFSHIAGHVYAKQRLSEVVGYLKNQFGQHTPDLPRGMLLYGPPGTGKTMLAKALAHEADLPFISTTGSEMLDPALARKVFARARRYAPSIVFIDEIDALGRRDSESGHVLAINQLLADIDGFDSTQRAPVFVIAATNLPNRVDPALVRAGRLDLHVEIPQLDRQARGFFVDKLLKLDHDGSLQTDNLLDLTAGMSGAELEKLRRELALDLLRGHTQRVTHRLVVEHINTIRYGQRTGKTMTTTDLDHVAYHEAGHAVISQVLDPDIKITQITIAPRANALGMVALSADDATHRRMTRDELMDRLCVLLAGRTAQVHRFGADGMDSGASEDLHQASRLATAAVDAWGFDDEHGLYSTPADAAALQQAVAPLVVARAKALLQTAQERCRKLTETHWDRIDHLAQRLRAEEWIPGADL